MLFRCQTHRIVNSDDHQGLDPDGHRNFFTVSESIVRRKGRNRCFLFSDRRAKIQ